MNALSFGSGVKTYTVNETCEISFNPASSQFAQKLLDTVDRCQQVMDETKKKQAAVEADKAAVFELAAEQDGKISEHIDSLFGPGKSAQLFTWGPTAWSDGLPVWLNFCMAILDEVAQNVTQQQGQASERMQEYMKKYEKYQRK